MNNSGNKEKALLELAKELERFVGDPKVPEEWKEELLGRKYLERSGSLTPISPQEGDVDE